MKRPAVDGRMFTPQLTAKAVATDDGFELVAPAVGLWRDAPRPGARVLPGEPIGTLEILGVSHRLLAPAEAGGVVRDAAEPALARRPVEFGSVLLSLDPNAVEGALRDTASIADATAGAGSLRLPSPLSGRYYAKPSPDKPPFVAVGDVLSVGQTVALLEVMKTFNRVTYGGDGLPERAKIVAIVPSDGDDVDEGDPLLDLEPA